MLLSVHNVLIPQGRYFDNKNMHSVNWYQNITQVQPATPACNVHSQKSLNQRRDSLFMLLHCIIIQSLVKGLVWTPVTIWALNFTHACHPLQTERRQFCPLLRGETDRQYQCRNRVFAQIKHAHKRKWLRRQASTFSYYYTLRSNRLTGL